MVRAARNEAEPPRELRLAWQCRQWNHLPESGGLLDQPAGLLTTMAQYLNIYDATTAYLDGGAAWAERNPASWELYAAARLIEMEYGD